MISFLLKNNSNKSCSGSILIFFMIALASLLTLMAMAINLNAYYVRKTQADSNAKAIALSALEEYYDSLNSCGTSCAKSDRYNYALNRAREVGNTNLILADSNDVGVETPNGAVLVPGTWERDTTICGTEPAPCFRELILNEFDNKQPNAFRIQGKLYPQGSSTFFGGGFLGIDKIGIKVDAVSSIVPRRGCFLVDISASTIKNTHKPFDYHYNSNYPCLDSRGNNAYCCPPNNQYAEFAYSLSSTYDFNTVSYNSLILDKAWACMQSYPNRGGDPANTNHYASDYRPYNLINDTQYTGDFTTFHPDPTIPPSISGYDYRFDKRLSYLIDEVASPEPMTTIMNGLKSAIDAFYSRAVAGDDLCLIFFDHKVAWPRIVKLTPGVPPAQKHAYLKSLTNLTKTAVSNPFFPEGFDNVIEHGIFPGEFSFTNLKQALSFALSEFARVSNTTGGNVPSSNFLVLISDGLINCRSCTAPEKAAGGVCSSPLREYFCSLNYAEHKKALDELRVMAYGTGGNSLQAQGIPLNVILVGDHVAPNTIDRFNPQTGQCMTDEENRAISRSASDTSVISNYIYSGNPSFIGSVCPNPPIPGSEQLVACQYERNSDTSPYYQINADLYDIAVKTRGLWGPIRPKCSSANPNPTCNTTVPGTGMSRCTAGCCTSYSSCYDGMAPRVMQCDGENNSSSEQINKYLEQIVSFNPYAVVKTD